MASFSFFPNNQVKVICDFSINVIERERGQEEYETFGRGSQRRNGLNEKGFSAKYEIYRISESS